MLLKHLNYAFRSIRRNKHFSAINITGLVVGLTVFILMALYIEEECSYDRFHHNAENVYRVADTKTTNAISEQNAGSAAPLAPALKRDFSDLQQVARLMPGEALVAGGEKMFEERKLFFADPAVFGVFDWPLQSGDERTALSEPMSVVITRSTAEKYFGSANPVGQTLLLDKKPAKVTGVLKALPAASHIQFDMLVSMATAEQKGSGYDWLFTNWYSTPFYTYAVLPAGQSAAAFTAMLAGFADRNGANTGGTRHQYVLEPLTDIYLHSTRQNQAGVTGNVRNLYIFSAIAVFVLLLACINFVNLSTARAGERAKEVGIKKVSGMSRGQLAIQFLSESLLTALAAMIFAVVLTLVLLPSFNVFSGAHVALRLTALHMSVLTALVLLIGLLSGAYPAWLLSSFPAAAALKGTLKTSMGNILVRKGLVVFQFTVSVILIIATMTVYRQMKFLQNHELGFQKGTTLVINFEGDRAVTEKYAFISERLAAIKGVNGVTSASKVPGVMEPGGWSMDIPMRGGDTLHEEMPVFATDFSFVSQFGISMVAGRALSASFAADSTESMIINEAAVRKMGLTAPAQAIGLQVAMYPKDARIVGVCKDFNFESLQKSIGPMAMRVLPGQFRVMALNLQTGDLPQTISAIEKEWKTLVPQRPLEFSFLDETFDRLYERETAFSRVLGIFTALAILIACFGLFGLAMFSVKQRRKEIGIRKVIGASVMRITYLLSSDFVALVFLAILIATPSAIWIAGKWMDQFAYRTTISAWIMIGAALIATFIALLTISYQTIRAARANPVRSLRSE